MWPAQYVDSVHGTNPDRPRAVASLLLEGASPSHADSAFEGAFALHVAACNCRTDAIQLLLVAGHDDPSGLPAAAAAA